MVKGVSYDNIEDDNQYNGAKVGENVIRKTMRAHRCNLRRKAIT